MSASATEIETIVQAVLQRLRSGYAQTELGAGQSLEAAPHPVKQQAILLDAKVVSLALLPEDLTRIDTLQVPAEAVVTPAVLDELRWKNVRLARIKRTAQLAGGEVDRRLLIVVPAGQRVAHFGCEQTMSSGNLPADVCRLAAHVNSGGRLAVWWCPKPYAAVRATSQNSSLHGVMLVDTSEWKRALQEADPNVLIVDSTKWGLPEIHGLVSALSEGDQP